MLSTKAIRENHSFSLASFYAPHPPLFPPKKHYQSCLKKDLPSIARGDWVNWEKLSPEGDQAGQRVLLEGEVLRKAQAGYYGLIDHIDQQIAPLIRDFKARSEKAGRPWVIVFTSDHGEMLGDHGYFRKCEPFEGSANVPFLITGSKAWALPKESAASSPCAWKTSCLPCSPWPAPRSPLIWTETNLLPTLRGETQQIRDWLHFEHAKCYSKEQAFQALTDGEWKYIWRPTVAASICSTLYRTPGGEGSLHGESPRGHAIGVAAEAHQASQKQTGGLCSEWQAHRRPPLRALERGHPQEIIINQIRNRERLL